jgi:hypothetical protein
LQFNVSVSLKISGWKILFRSYSDVLGEEEGKVLNKLINEAGNKLEK